ncbi:hypothetical protein Tco_1304876 [Tanacetum coccineum]
MSSMGELTFFLRLQVIQRNDGIFISQDKYMADILKKFIFSSVKTASTPIETNKALLKDEEAEDVDVHLYRLMIGSLMFQVTPKVSHLHAVKSIFRYLKGQLKLGLWYPKDSPFDLEAFSDSDYAGASLDRKSTKRDSYEKKLIQVIKIHTDHNVADLLTKAFDVSRFNFLFASIGLLNLLIVCSTAQVYLRLDERECDIKQNMERAATTASSLEVEQDSDGSGSGLKYQVTILETATVNTLDNGEQEIIATVDGHAKTVTIASVRKYLKLADVGGLSSLPNTEIFDQLSLMGYAITSDKLTSQKGHFSPQWRLLSLHKRTYITPTLTQKLFSNMRTATKGYYGEETHLFPTMLAIDQLGQVANEAAFTGVNVVHGGAATTVSSIDARQGGGNIPKSPTMPHHSPLPGGHTHGSDEGSLPLHELMVSNNEENEEDPSKKGRISTVVPKVTTADAKHNTAITFVSTASPQRHTYTTAETLMEIRKSAAKTKGKAIMQEYEQPKKIKKRIQIQMSLDEELAQKLHEE